MSCCFSSQWGPIMMLCSCHGYCSFCGNNWQFNHLRCIHGCSNEMCSVVKRGWSNISFVRNSSGQKVGHNFSSGLFFFVVFFFLLTLAKWSWHSIAGKHTYWSVRLCVDQLKGIAYSCINTFDPWCVNNTQADKSTYDKSIALALDFYVIKTTTFHVLINFQ